MPPYTFVPVTAADRESISTIFCLSYASNAYFRLQYRGLSISEIIPGFILRFPAGNLSKPNSWHYKLLDDAQDKKPIAFARWILPERLFQRLSLELNAQGGVMGVEGESKENMLRYAKEREEGYVNGEPFGMDPRVPAEASKELNAMRARIPVLTSEYIVVAFLQEYELFTQNHTELEALHTLPEHERMGAGSALMKWGIQLADNEGLPIRLLATSRGIGLYKKFGFVELGQVTFDLSRWGGEGDFTYYMMGREPNV